MTDWLFFMEPHRGCVAEKNTGVEIHPKGLINWFGIGKLDCKIESTNSQTMRNGPPRQSIKLMLCPLLLTVFIYTAF